MSDDLVQLLRESAQKATIYYAANDPDIKLEDFVEWKAADRIEELEELEQVALTNRNMLMKRNVELEANKKDILAAVKRMDYGYIESVYLGYDDDGNPPK